MNNLNKEDMLLKVKVLDNGRLLLFNPKDMSTEEWEIIAKYASLTGYGINEASIAKETYTRLYENVVKRGDEGYLFNEDIGNAIKEWLFDTTVVDYSLYAKECAAEAEKTFGTTNRLDLAGYLDINGKFLRLSYDGYQRDMDHREITSIIEDHGLIPEDHDYSDGLIRFMDQGNIRLLNYGIDISTYPNECQWVNLRRFYDTLDFDGMFYIDFSAKGTGSTIGNARIADGCSFGTVKRVITEFFDTGVVPSEYAA